MNDPFPSPHLRDPVLADHFAAFGFCTLPLIDGEASDALRRVFDTMFGGGGEGFLSTVMQPAALRRAAHDQIVPHVASALGRHLSNHRIAMCSFVARYPGSDQSDLPLHQDWSFVDERFARSMSVWIPLQAVDRTNGCMTIVPASHRHDQPARGIGSGFRYRELEPHLRARHLVDQPLARGEAILFEHRLIHGSRSNLGIDLRLAVGIVLVPSHVPLTMGIPRADGNYAFSRVEDDFLLDADFAAMIRAARDRPGKGQL